MKCGVVWLVIMLMLTGCTGRTMNRVITSWQGATLDEVVQAWGYPSGEKTIAGHHLYSWDEYHGASASGGFWPGAQKWGGVSVHDEYCTRILEVGGDNRIIGGQWEGTDCPKLFSSWEHPATAPPAAK